MLTFNSCGTCRNCRSGRPAYCLQVIPLSFGGTRPDGSTPLGQNGARIHGFFFGQSSFATHALATERNVVKVDPQAPLELLGPLGCGIQTGAGAVLNSLNAEPGQSIAVFGVGSVGLSAIMAAKHVGCGPIIAVDRVEARLDLASDLGATKIILNGDLHQTVEEIRSITDAGADYSLDTTGSPDVLRAAVESLGILGTCGLIGGAAAGIDVHLEMNHLLLGRNVRGIVQGDSVPDEFIPRLLDLHQSGEFPFDRLIRFYELDAINQAVEDMQAARAIKPVLRMEE